MSKQHLYTIRAYIEELGGICSPDDVRRLEWFDERLVEAIERHRPFPDTAESKAERLRIYHAFKEELHDRGLDQHVSGTDIEAYASARTEFDASSQDAKESHYLSRIGDHMQELLRGHSAHDLMYVPLHAAFLRYGEAKSGRAQPKRSRGTRIVERIVESKDPILIIRGLPGAGKSVAMRQATLRVAKRGLGLTGGAIPVFIPLGQLGTHSAKLGGGHEEVLAELSRYCKAAVFRNKELQIGYRFVGDHLPRLLLQGRIFLFLDGMDELPRQHYDETCRSLLEFARHWSQDKGNRIVISCRDFDYPKELRIDSLVIFPFEWSDVDAYLTTHLPAPDLSRRRSEALTLWNDSRAGRALLDNPFFLHLVIKYIQDRPSDPLPANKGLLFNEYVDRVFRRSATTPSPDTTSRAIERLLQDLALWLTDCKVSGTRATWKQLEDGDGGFRGAAELSACRTYATLKYFVDVSPDGVVFQHHRVREFFAARALQIRMQSTPQNSVELYLSRISVDIWYFETVILLASILMPPQFRTLVSCILTPRGHINDLPYRAILAAECLESSALRRDEALSSTVYGTLKSCIENQDTGKVDKVECWQALGRLRLGTIQLGELAIIVNDTSRFVREEAMMVVGSHSDEALPACVPAASGLILDAAKIGAVDRLWTYGTWVFRPAFRLPVIQGLYVLFSLASLLGWLLPIPVIVCVGLVTPFPYSLVLYVASALVGTIEFSLWFNEDKRSLQGCLQMIKAAAGVPPVSPTKPKQQAKPTVLRSVPKQESVDQRLFFDKDALETLAKELEEADDVTKYLISAKLLMLGASLPTIDASHLRALLVTELRELATLVAISIELRYKVSRKSLQELCTRIVKGESSTLSSVAADVICALRSAARQGGSLSAFVFEKEKGSTNQPRSEQFIDRDEIDYLLKRYQAHSYNCILFANGLISEQTLGAAEQQGRDDILREAAIEVLGRIKSTISVSGDRVDRPSVKAAFDRLNEVVVNPGAIKDIIESAVDVLIDNGATRIEQFRIRRFFAYGAVVVLVISAGYASSIFLKYRENARIHGLDAKEHATQAAEKQREADSIMTSGAHTSGTPPSVLPASTFDAATLHRIASEIVDTRDVGQYLLRNGVITPEQQGRAAIRSAWFRNSASRETARLGDLVGSSTELNFVVPRDAVASMYARLLDHGQGDASVIATELVFDLRRRARKSGGLPQLRYDFSHVVTDKQSFVEYVLPDELAFVGQPAAPHSYLAKLWANGFIQDSLFESSEGSKDEGWLADSLREFLEIVNRSGGPIPRASLLSAIQTIGSGFGNSSRHRDLGQTALRVFEDKTKQWLAAKHEADQKAAAAADERRRAAEETQLASQARWHLLGIAGFLLLVIAPCIGWLSWKYFVPRVELSRLDSTLYEDVGRLMRLASDDSRDVRLRVGAARKLGISDDSRALECLQRIVESGDSPEALVTEVHRALHHRKLRQMRQSAHA